MYVGPSGPPEDKTWAPTARLDGDHDDDDHGTEAGTAAAAAAAAAAAGGGCGRLAGPRAPESRWRPRRPTVQYLRVSSHGIDSERLRWRARAVGPLNGSLGPGRRRSRRLRDGPGPAVRLDTVTGPTPRAEP